MRNVTLFGLLAVLLLATGSAAAQSNNNLLQKKYGKLYDALETYAPDDPAIIDDLIRQVRTDFKKYGANARRKYINLSFTTQTLEPLGESWLIDNGESPESKIGAAFTVGKTYYVHRKPLGGIVRFGIDGTFFDINYANYKSRYVDEWYDGSSLQKEVYESTLHQAEIGVQVGPSVTVTPVSKLKVHAYFRYAPSFAALYSTEAETIAGGYASFFVTGGSVSFGAIGIGAEYRWGKGNYKEFGASDDEGDIVDGEYIATSKTKFKTSGARIYLNFRF